MNLTVRLRRHLNPALVTVLLLNLIAMVAAPGAGVAQAQGSGVAEMDIGAHGPNGHEIGARFTVTTEDGEYLGACTLEGEADAPWLVTCQVSVPRYTTVVVTLDIESITPGYAPVENPLLFDTSGDPGAASSWGVTFELEPVGGSARETGAIDIALITRDPEDGDLLTGTCYVLVDYSNEGCDENGDGQVTFADIPFGTYTVRQTQTPPGYPAIDDYEIDVAPTGYVESVSFEAPLGFIVKQAPEQNAPNTRNVSVVFLDMLTHERVPGGGCVELLGASLVGCDRDLVDGQVDFLDVPAGGPYELSFSNLADGFEVTTVDAVRIEADPGVPANIIIVVLLMEADDAAVTTVGPGESDEPVDAQDPNGYDAMVGTWLGKRRDIILHADGNGYIDYRLDAFGNGIIYELIVNPETSPVTAMIAGVSSYGDVNLSDFPTIGHTITLEIQSFPDGDMLVVDMRHNGWELNGCPGNDPDNVPNVQRACY